MKQILSSWVVLFLIVSAVAQTTTTATPRRKAASQSVAAELQEFREALAAQQKQIEALQKQMGTPTGNPDALDKMKKELEK